MFLKLLAIILAVGVLGCTLLVNRQQQIEAAHEMSRIHQRLSEQERIIWELRAGISSRCSPDRLQQMRQRFEHEWQPIVLDHWPQEQAAYAGSEEPITEGLGG